MARPSWLVDGKRIATKIKSASGSCDPRKVIWKSNPCRTCPNCSQRIDNTDVSQEWPGLPRGVKFDPSDQELLWHLMTKVENAADAPHPFIDEFIPSVLEEDGICYTHPEKLPGVKKDGSIAHFFHRTMNAYNTGTRKRRRIHGGHDSVQGDVRWHKTGKTKPVLVDSIRKGWKKIMVLYASSGKGGKAEKTNWVMHQYHLGDEEEEKDGALVVSKVFYQQPQQSKQKDKYDEDALYESVQPSISSLDPATPIPARNESLANKVQNGGDPVQNQHKFEDDLVQELVSYSKESSAQVIDPEMVNEENGASSQPGFERIDDQMANEENGASSQPGYETIDDQNIHSADPKWWEGESQNILDSQQLLEALYTCDEILQSQSSADNGVKKPKPCLADYTRIGVEAFKKDLEECSKLNHVDSTNVVQESPNDIRLSQLDIPIGSQDSFSWLKLE